MPYNHFARKTNYSKSGKVNHKIFGWAKYGPEKILKKLSIFLMVSFLSIKNKKTKQIQILKTDSVSDSFLKLVGPIGVSKINITCLTAWVAASFLID